jgi:signal transduction histidine kinase
VEPWVFDLYLISLEIINNSFKHGKATSVIIEFYGYPDCYVFQFSDNGIGFNDKSFQKGFGLDNIEKRILFYKGVFEINSTENQGSTIQISIPK